MLVHFFFNGCNTYIERISSFLTLSLLVLPNIRRSMRISATLILCMWVLFGAQHSGPYTSLKRIIHLKIAATNKFECVHNVQIVVGLMTLTPRVKFKANVLAFLCHYFFYRCQLKESCFLVSNVCEDGSESTICITAALTESLRGFSDLDILRDLVKPVLLQTVIKGLNWDNGLIWHFIFPFLVCVWVYIPCSSIITIYYFP